MAASAHVLWTAIGIFGCGETQLSATEILDVSATGGAEAEYAGGSNTGSAPVRPLVPSAIREPSKSLLVEGRFLRDHCGVPLILRGATEMVIWSEGRDGDPEFSEIAKTGANAVRVVWLLSEGAEQLEIVLRNAKDAGLVAILEFHDNFDVLGDAAALNEITDYLTSEEIVAVIKRHQKALVIELEGKVWTDSAPAEWARLFGHAIIDLRAAGIVVPIAVHEPSWDADIESLRRHVPSALSQDPIKNSLYAMASWDGKIEELRETIQVLSSEQVALYVAEFSGFESENCPETEVDVSAVLSTTFEFDIGWFAWSWGGVPNMSCGAVGFFDMTSDGTFEGLAHWGLRVAKTDPYSIRATASPLLTADLDVCPPE